MRALYLLVPLLACVASSMLLAVFLSGRIEHRANRAAALLVAGAIVWSFCEVLWNSAGSAAEALWLVKVSSIGWVAIGPLGLQVLASATGRDGPRLRRTLPFLFALAFGFFVVDLATPWIHPGIVETNWGWSYQLGPAYLAFYAFTMACLSTGLGLAVGASPSLSPAERAQVRVLAAGILVPMVVASLTDGLLPLLGQHPPRFGTASFAFLGGTIAWSFHRYGHSLLAPRTFANEILASLGDGVALLHVDGRIRSANAALGGILGVSASDLEGLPASEFIPALAGDPLTEVPDRETEVVGVSGTVPVALASTLLRDKRAMPLGLILVVRDLREVVALRRKLLTTSRLRAVGSLAAGIAHEINNPVAYVRTNLGFLRKQLEQLADAGVGDTAQVDLAESVDLLGESLEGLDRIASVVRDLKGLAGGEQTVRETVELNGMIQSLVRMLAPHVRYGAQVEVNCTDVPAVAGSPQELKQIFTDLLLQACTSIEPEGRIRVETAWEDDQAVVRIEDDGQGMSPEELDRAFDPVVGADGEEGFGMAIAWQVVRQHGGELLVESEPGAGTRVAVRLPVAS